MGILSFSMLVAWIRASMLLSGLRPPMYIRTNFPSKSFSAKNELISFSILSVSSGEFMTTDIVSGFIPRPTNLSLIVSLTVIILSANHELIVSNMAASLNCHESRPTPNLAANISGIASCKSRTIFFPYSLGTSAMKTWKSGKE